MADAFVLTPGALTLPDLRALLDAPRALKLDPASHHAIDRSAAIVQAVIDRGETAYGINTGFGAWARTHITDDQLTELQRRLVLSHAAGTGAPLPDSIVRAILILKINGLARGFSGIRRSVIESPGALLSAARSRVPCSPRCQPRVRAAALALLRPAADIIGRECNAVSDNPLVFADQ